MPTEAESKVKSWGFTRVFTWTDGPNAHYPPHTHAGLTTHLITNGDMVLWYPDDPVPEKTTFCVGAREDVDAGRLHQVSPSANWQPRVYLRHRRIAHDMRRTRFTTQNRKSLPDKEIESTEHIDVVPTVA